MKITVTDKTPAAGDRIHFLCTETYKESGLEQAEFSGKKLSTAHTHVKGKRAVFAGVGDNPDHALISRVAGAAIRKLHGLGGTAAVIDLKGKELYAGAIAEGLVLGHYKFEDFLPKERQRKHVIKTVTIIVNKAELTASRKAVKDGTILADATNTVRTMGNLPGNYITPEELGKQAQALAKATGITAKVWSFAQLKKEGFGGILAVGTGSVNKPRFIRMDYKCGKKKAPIITIVGKAITFDTGGISLKPGASMDEMKFDKMGGCAVFGIMEAVAKLKLPVNVVGLVSAAENMPDGEAYRPGDIVTTLDGQTIEVLNTDAEGRVVLADALAYNRMKVKPDATIDFATLTGACVVALGNNRAGIFSEDDKLVDALKKSSKASGDSIWHMPLGEDFDAMIKSDIATVKNVGPRWGGASTAAAFLQKWAGDGSWAHIDIAGPAWITETRTDLEKGATGFGVRLIIDYLKNL